MAEAFISNLKKGDRIEDAQYAVRVAGVRKKNQSFLYLELGDLTGTIQGRMFRTEEMPSGVEVGGVVQVQGRVDEYKDELQVVVTSIEAVADINPAKFIPSITIEEVRKHRDTIDTRLGQIKDPDIKQLAEALREHKLFQERFFYWPGGRQIHHGRLGGLGQHTAEVLEAALVGYQGKLADYIIFGAVFHDVGKMVELDVKATIEFTDAGHLINHTQLGLLYIRKVMQDEKLLLSDPRGWHLLHVVDAHLGRWGTTPPRTEEAERVHWADSLSAKADGKRMLTERLAYEGQRYGYEKYRGKVWVPPQLRNAEPYFDTAPIQGAQTELFKQPEALPHSDG